ncbi:hypothetical protein BHE74_00007534, partial [Ensete ventricosum]
RSIFHAPSRNYKILVIPNVLANWKSYEHGFTKKRDGHKHYAKSGFDLFFVHRLRISKYWSFPMYQPMGSHTSMVSQKTTMVIKFAQSLVQSRVSIIFHAPTWNFKILVIPNVFAHGKTHEHGSAKKHDGHKLYAKSLAKSRFDWFFVHRLGIPKYWQFPTY